MSDGATRPRYTFGDTHLAAERLLLVARVFEAASHAFLTDTVTSPPTVALDLGCGPGATTRLLAEVAGATRVVGLDVSTAFLEIAATDAPAGVDFAVHDATLLPLPYAPVDLIFCRLLLAHLPDPAAIVAAWSTQLAPGGLLLADEVEWIETNHPVLERYERMVVGLVGSRGAPMYAGPIIDRVDGSPGWHRESSDVRVLPVATADAARMYGMNLATWRHDPFIRDHHTAGAVDELATDLAALAGSRGSDEITWGVRQVAWRRTE